MAMITKQPSNRHPLFTDSVIQRWIRIFPFILIILLPLLAGCHRENEVDRRLAKIEEQLNDSVVDIQELTAMFDSISRGTYGDIKRENVFNLLELRLSMGRGEYPQNDALLNSVVGYFGHNSYRRRLAEALILRSYYRLYHDNNFKAAMTDAITARDLSYETCDTLLMARSEKLLMLNFEPVYKTDSVLYHANLSNIYYAAVRHFNMVREVKRYYAVYLNSKGQTDDALVLMDSVLHNTQKDDSLALGEIFNRKIGMYLAKGDYMAADSSFRKAIGYFGENYRENIDWRFVLMMFNESGQTDSLERYLPLMRDYCFTSDGNDFYYHYCQLLAESRGDYKTAYENLKYVYDIMNERSQIAVDHSPSIVTSDYFNHQAAIERDKVRSRNNIILLVILVSCCVVAGFYFIMKTQRKRHIERELKAVIEISSLKEQFSTAQADRTIAERLFKSGFDSLDKLIVPYFSLNFHGNITSEKFMEELSEQMEKIRSKETLEKLVEEIDQLHKGILTEISTAIPTIKREDVYFLALRIAGMSHKSICFILGITPTNYYTKWQRIRQRIETADATTIERLRTILS